MKNDAPYAGLVLGFLNCARQLLERDGKLMMVTAFVRDLAPFHVSPILWETDQEKWKKLFACGMIMKKTNCDSLIVVSDAALRSFDKVSKEQAEYIQNNLATESPLTVPEGMLGRRECIIVNYLSPVAKISDMAVQAYRHEGADRHIVFEERIDQELSQGMDGMIQDMVYDGFAADVDLSTVEQE